MKEDIWVSAAVRLVKMMVELHRRGYQQLRIFPYEYPIAWRLFIAPRRYFSSRNGAYAAHSGDDGAIYSSSQELEYFGWPDAKHCDAEELAGLFMKRFPEICEEGFGPDWEYAGWLSQLSGHMSRTREIPFVMAEFFKPGPEDITFLPLRGENGAVTHFPLPPPVDANRHDFKQEIETLRRRCAELEEKIEVAKAALSY